MQHFANLEVGQKFLRGDSLFVKRATRKAECLISGHGFDRVRSISEFGDSVPVQVVTSIDEVLPTITKLFAGNGDAAIKPGEVTL